MSKLLIVFGFTLSCISMATFAYEYRIGVIENPPHVFIKEGSPRGRAVEFMKAVINNSGSQSSFFNIPIKRALKLLKEGKLDALLPFEDSQETTSTLTKPLFKLVPGLCFRKEDFIPILSATHLFKDLKIGYTDGVELAEPLANSQARLISLKGESALDRGLKMLQANRFDAFYHPNPIFLYHQNNPLSKQVACSYFHGLSSNTYIAVSDKLSKEKLSHLETSFSAAMDNQSYTQFVNSY